MLRELLFNDEFKNVVLDSTKQTTSRVSLKSLMTHDTFYYEDVLFVVTQTSKMKVKDVDYRSESFNSTQEFCQKLSEIYNRVFTVDDEVFTINFQRVDVR